MARLHEGGESEDELPDLSTILVAVKNFQKGVQNDYPSTRKAQRATKIQSTLSSQNKDLPKSPHVRAPSRGTVKASFGDQQARKQKPLRLAHVNSLLLSTVNGLLKSPVKQFTAPQRLEHERSLRNVRRRAEAGGADCTAFMSDLQNTIDSTEDDASVDDLSDFVVNDSASQTEMERLQSVGRYVSGSPRKLHRNIKNNKCSDDDSFLQRHESLPITIDLVSPDKKPASAHIITRTEASPNDDFNVDPFSNLQFSPPRSRSPCKTIEDERLVTPPPSPSKPKLQSPSKSRPRVPPSPHRPSLDAFWSQDIINDWNDQYSPRKTPRPRRLFSMEEEDEGNLSPSGSPRKSPLKSPAKRDKEAIKRKKIFDQNKHVLASSFLEELDRTVADGQVASLAASTGGIRIIWSKKLNSTAGRANWKREAIRTKSGDGTTSSTTYRHHASIELAEKVIDDEDRLLNVLAHEYCHLANFMISNIKDNPHGKEFKEWAKKVSDAFAHRHITVTTKHTYAITYKYIWGCTVCGVEFKRHSKSIDPARHTCGSCKGKLVQVQPAPRGGNEGDGKKVVSGYQAYVKEHYGRIKRENAAMGMGEIMGVLGRGYREEKEKRERDGGKKNGEVVEVVEVVEVGNDGDVDGDGDGEELTREGDLDVVARKLDILSLRGEEEN
ncbi:hypothetical protein MMC18_005260 [Xylographa bjoerkii]|nr:hypothetical protein [Xylographa bjoerkii]